MNSNISCCASRLPSRRPTYVGLLDTEISRAARQKRSRRTRRRRDQIIYLCAIEVILYVTRRVDPFPHFRARNAPRHSARTDDSVSSSLFFPRGPFSETRECHLDRSSFDSFEAIVRSSVSPRVGSRSALPSAKLIRGVPDAARNKDFA